MFSYKKIIFTFFLAIFTFTGVVTPRPANAFFADIIGGFVAPIKLAWELAEAAYDEVQGIVGAELSNRTVAMFVDSFAYDIATEMATGAAGGKPLFRTVSIRKSLENSKDVALGNFVGELTSKNFADLGINLCDPSIALKLSLTLGLIDSEKPPAPKCDWNKLRKSWTQYDETVQANIIKFQLSSSGENSTSLKDFFGGIFSKEQSDLGIAFTLNERLLELKEDKKTEEELTAIECQGHMDKTTTISADIVQTCATVMNMSDLDWWMAWDASQSAITERKIAATNKSLASIIKDASNKFVNTFASKLMKNFIKGSWSLFGSTDSDTHQDFKTTLIDRLRGGANIRQPRGVDIFKELKTVNIESLESFDYISDFTICPNEFRGPDNCVISPAFLQAINNKITIQQAIDQGIINGQTPFVHPNDAINHTVDKCYRDGFCYSNLVKLRKANMVPVGWELAALRAPVSLQQAIDCFEESPKCNFDISNDFVVSGNDHNPFYHLIDPDWVMKAPDIRCDAYAYSAILESPNSSSRKQYCADPKVCLKEDSNGNCLDDQFNYCTRSENTWNFQGESCVAGEAYAGCQTFNNKEFGNNSYIQDTLEYCTSNQAGCKRYSQDKDGIGNWSFEDVTIDPNDLFLNNQAIECSGDNAGCSEYIVLSPDAGTNVVPNGSFDDLNDDGFPDGWTNADGITPADGIEDLTGANNANGVILDYDGDRLPNGYTLGSYYPDSEIVKTKVFLQANTSYILSIDAAQYDDIRNYRARTIITMCDNVTGCNESITPADSIDGLGTCLFDEGGHENNVDMDVFPTDTNMERHSCSFMTNDFVDYAFIWLVGMPYSPDPEEEAAVWFDNIKIETVSSVDALASAYSDYGKGAKIYMGSNTVMCSADEVGCQGYLPDNGDPMIPAVITQGDLCSAECVGYDTFTEQANIFDIIEGDNFVEYYNFIPETARQCPDQEIGCEEFTNLDVLAEGGEGREYFTYLRQCVEPALGEVYYTWEGTEVSGYQIKTWNALESNINAAPCTNMAPAGDNCQDDLDPPATCTAADLDDNLNCRAFFDINGDVHYMLQDRVIFATNNCHDYRRAASNQIYKAVPEESTHCAAANNGCSSYYGNNANNSRIVFNDTFEQGTYAPWEGNNADLSNVSLSNNGHSLRVDANGGFDRDMMDLKLQNNKEYIVSWWMKSDTVLSRFYLLLMGNNNPNWSFSVNFADADKDSAFRNIEPGRWHYYTASAYVDSFTPENMATIQELDFHMIVMGSLPDQGVYIDNFTLKEVENDFSVVRNSWNTPTSCDDPYAGYQLGCKEYTDLNGQKFNLKSFDHLCREEAIGCMPVIDTHNSTNPFAEVFNVGDYSSTIVEADNIDYLVPNQNNYCSQEYKGCTELGLPDRLDETNFSTVYKINDPDKYDSILCDHDGLNCEEYNTVKGVFYFKDPGLDTCSYQQNILIEGSSLSGWFKTSTLDDPTPLGCADEDGVYDIDELIIPRSYCVYNDDDTVLLNFFTRTDCENNDGAWISYSPAAQCPSSEDTCTSFRDPADPIGCDPKINDADIEGYCSNTDHDNEIECINDDEEWTPRCKDYYYYDNSEIDETSCNGLVDRQDGCALFYDANDWDGEHNQVITIYDSNETYEDIEASNRAFNPVVCDPDFDPTCTLDANKLIKVSKDRQCSEWLACKSSTAVKGDNDEYKIICDDLATCVEFQYNADSNTTKCKKWGSYDEDIEALTFEKYQSRDTGLRNHISWSDKEYIGYSVPNMLPVNELSVYVFGEGNDQTTRLVYNVTNDTDGVLGDYYSDCVEFACSSGLDVTEGECTTAGFIWALRSLDGRACTAQINVEGDYSFKGECQESVCWVNPSVNKNTTSTHSLETRAYAVIDSPFPAAIESNGTQRDLKYDRANICSNNESSINYIPNSCEESFKKVVFGKGQEILYYPENDVAGEIPAGICTAGELVGKDVYDNVLDPNKCIKNSDCDTDPDSDRSDGLCTFVTEEISYKNWPGICLEYDYDYPLIKDGKEKSYYCNQWYPAQKIKGTASLYDNYREAGYYDAKNRDALFCAVAEPYTTTEDRYYCGYFENGLNCNVLIRIPSGSKVNLDMASQYPGLLEIGSWIEDSDNLVTPANFEHPGDSDFVIRDTIRTFGQKFDRLTDFNNVELETSDFMNVLDDMFDATETGEQIHRFYWDVRVGINGAFTPGAFVNVPMELNSLDQSGATCGECPSWIYDTPTGAHNVYINCRRGGQCGFHKWRHGLRYSNPLTFNYYVDVSDPNEAYIPPPSNYLGSCAANCQFVDNGDATYARGRGCLENAFYAPRYTEILNDPIYLDLSGNFNLSACTAAEANDNDCLYVNCVNNLGIENLNVHSCNEYSACQAYLSTWDDANDVEVLIATAALNDDVALCINDNWDKDLPQIYDPSEYDACLENNKDIFTQRRFVDGSLQDVVDQNALEAFCNTCQLEIFPSTYDSLSLGTDCDTTDSLDCYQQCRIVSHLDSEGSLSAVRTDIWWRSANEPSLRAISEGFLPWTSWYWKPNLGYVSSTEEAYDDDEVFYGEIANIEAVDDYPLNFSHFGAALGRFNPSSIVSTRVPYFKNNPDNLTAGTFFGYLRSFPATIDDAIDDASFQMQDLFYKVYNFKWVSTTGTYVPVTPNPYSELGGGNGRNIYAGPDYAPRIFSTCGDGFCGPLDADGDAIAEEGITVNNQIDGTLIGQKGSLFVSTKFFYHAHPDHMPVYSVGVDWGDGPTDHFSLSPGKYKNSLPEKYCDPDISAPGDANPLTLIIEPQLMGFAGKSDACQTGYKIFYHDYLYDSTGDNDCNGLGGKPLEPNASCYQPSINVFDNWKLETRVAFDGWIVVKE